MSYSFVGEIIIKLDAAIKASNIQYLIDKSEELEEYLPEICFLTDLHDQTNKKAKCSHCKKKIYLSNKFC